MFPKQLITRNTDCKLACLPKRKLQDCRYCTCGPRPFIMRWDTRLGSNSPNNQITIPTDGPGFDYIVDWGDGIVEDGFTGNATHVYATPGIYIVKVTGSFPHIYFAGGGDREKITQIIQWGDIQWTSWYAAFTGCINMDIIAKDTPDLSLVTSARFAFQNCTSLTGGPAIGLWDVSTIDDFGRFFFSCVIFNADISQWNTSSAISFFQMFSQCSAFNQDISGWNTSTVQDMNAMFFNCSAFNQPIGVWDTSSVTNMRQILQGASSFNQPLNSWDTSNVTQMQGAFCAASSFNQPLSNWDVSKAVSFNQMFFSASSFNQSLGNWNPELVADYSQCLDGTNISKANYDALWLGWSLLPTLQPNMTFDAVNLNYSFGAPQAARQLVITNRSWTINDSGPL